MELLLGYSMNDSMFLSNVPQLVYLFINYSVTSNCGLYNKMFMRILVSLLFFLLSNAIWAQQDTVYVLGGTIDAMSFQPIEDVQVVALNARGDTVAVDRSVDQYKLYGIDNNW